jgi:hypothetical protein
VSSAISVTPHLRVENLRGVCGRLTEDAIDADSEFGSIVTQTARRTALDSDGIM